MENERAVRLCRLGQDHYYAFKSGGDRGELDAAIRTFREAVEHADESRSSWPIVIGGLGAALWERSRANWARDRDLEEALQCFDRALAVTPADSPHRFRRLHNRAFARLERHRLVQDEHVLIAALDDFREAVGLASDQTGLAATSHGLGRALLDLWRTGRNVDLDEAISYLRTSVDRGPTDNRFDYPTYLEDLGSALLERYHHVGRDADLDEAVECLRSACLLATARDRPSFSNGLGAALLARYQRDGASADLDDAVAAMTDAAAASVDALQRSGYRGNLGCALQARYEQLGDIGDLDDAIRCFRSALALTPRTSPERALRLNNLGQGLHTRHRLTRSRRDVQEAVRCFKMAVRLTPARSRDRPVRLNNLGLGLHDRYTLSGSPHDRDSAIESFRRAVTGADARSRPAYLDNLGVCLLDRYAATSIGSPGAELADLDAADLKEALECCREAVEHTPADSPDLAVRRGNLALAHSHEYAHSGDPITLEQAVEGFRSSAEACTESALPFALSLTREWLGFATNRRAWPEAREAARQLLVAWQRLVGAQLAVADMNARLRESAGLPAIAAYVLARTGPDSAAEAATALERSRAVVLSERLQRDRADLSKMESSGHRGLAERFRSAATRLMGLQRGRNGRDTASRSWRNQLRSAAVEFDAVIHEIQQAGSPEFMRLGAFTEIVEAAKPAPIVYLAATELGGVAIVVRSGGAVDPIMLPELTPAAMTEPCRRYFETYTAYLRREVDRPAWESALDDMTVWLWDVALGLLTKTLSPAKQVVLVPCGILGLLPLHAAHGADRTDCVLDQMTVSYALNARTLLASQRHAESTSAAPVLVVAAEDKMTGAKYEIDSVVAEFGPQSEVVSENGSRHDVLRKLAASSVVHFACHGRADLVEPLRSCLILPNGDPLTLEQVMEQRLPGTRLAVLAACEASLPGVGMPDEVVGLPAGFLLAGAAGSIGPLWPVDTLSTLALFARFYELWRREGTSPAVALAQAQLWLRDQTNGELQEHFPGVPQLGPDARWPDWLRSDWASSRRRAHPYHWAAFTYLGA